tara:strand:- start:84 stop:344 length:261 start_codon:yes stop_codon:yes gene_type:complete
MELHYSSENKDSLMRASFEILTKNFTKSVNRFIVYKEGSQNIEIPHGIGQRSKYIDLLINHFTECEEYEKCSMLQELRELVTMAGD